MTACCQLATGPVKWHHIFHPSILKLNHMPNQANSGKSSKNSGQGQTGDPTTKSSAPKPNPERSDIKHGSGDHTRDHEGDTSRSSNQGRKEASGGGND